MAIGNYSKNFETKNEVDCLTIKAKTPPRKSKRLDNVSQSNSPTFGVLLMFQGIGYQKN